VTAASARSSPRGSAYRKSGGCTAKSAHRRSVHLGDIMPSADGGGAPNKTGPRVSPAPTSGSTRRRFHRAFRPMQPGLRIPPTQKPRHRAYLNPRRSRALRNNGGNPAEIALPGARDGYAAGSGRAYRRSIIHPHHLRIPALAGTMPGAAYPPRSAEQFAIADGKPCRARPSRAGRVIAYCLFDLRRPVLSPLPELPGLSTRAGETTSRPGPTRSGARAPAACQGAPLGKPAPKRPRKAASRPSSLSKTGAAIRALRV
jgi:hypothetical protein